MKNDRVTHWDNVAKWYDELNGAKGSPYHQKVIFPNLLKIINPLGIEANKLNLLDLACGQGAWLRLLKSLNVNVLGIELSKELVESAKKYDETINYIQADILKLTDENGELLHNLQKETYDVVTIILAIQNIEFLSNLWKSIHCLLKPQGSLVIVMMHPCFRVPQYSDWYFDEKKMVQNRIISKYLKSQPIDIKANPSEELNSKTTTHFHRPLQAYINTLGNNGLYIDHIEELTTYKTEQENAKKEAMDNAKKEFPMFLTIRARKF